MNKEEKLSEGGLKENYPPSRRKIGWYYLVSHVTGEGWLCVLLVAVGRGLESVEEREARRWSGLV